jgi:hypothetical protein
MGVGFGSGGSGLGDGPGVGGCVRRETLERLGDEGGRYREDVDAREIEERFGVPVDRAVLSA